jgi:hypothetical protein
MLNTPIALALLMSDGTALANPDTPRADALLLLVIGVALVLISLLIQGLSRLANADREKYDPLKKVPRHEVFAATEQGANASLTHESEHV